MFTSATTCFVLSVVLIDIWQRIQGLWFWIFL